MAAMTGSSARPAGVSEYSTRGGISGYCTRSTIPSASSSASRRLSVLSPILGTAAPNAEKRCGPESSRAMIWGVHLRASRVQAAHPGS